VLDNDFVVVGLCGAAGDQSPIDLIRRYRGEGQYYRRSDSFDMENHIEGAIRIGKRIGREIIDCMDDAMSHMKKDAFIQTESAVIDFPVRRVTTTQYEAALKALRGKVAQFGTKELTPGQASDVYIYAGLIERYFEQDDIPVIPSQIIVARFDDIAFWIQFFDSVFAVLCSRKPFHGVRQLTCRVTGKRFGFQCYFRL